MTLNRHWSHSKTVGPVLVQGMGALELHLDSVFSDTSSF